MESHSNGDFKRLLVTKDRTCFPISLACITNIDPEEMPRYFNCNFEVPGFMRLLEDWLKKRGYKLCASFEENGLDYPKGKPVIALGISNNYGHACIFLDGHLAHDVTPGGPGGNLEVDAYLWCEPVERQIRLISTSERITKVP